MPDLVTHTKTCPICKFPQGFTFLTRRQIPVHQNLMLASAAEARAFPRGDLRMTACQQCGFVHNELFEPERLSYNEHYENSQTYSPTFRRYTDGLIDALMRRGVRNARVVEIGCGKGQFLRRMVEVGAAREAVGFDPSYVGVVSDLGGRIRFETRFFDQSCIAEPFDVVVCRHVIEHIAAPRDLLTSLRAAMQGSERIFFETPDVDWILRNQVIWDFFYEHCSLFSPSSLASAFELSGFEVIAVDQVFSGQYQFLEARPAASPALIPRSAGATVSLAQSFAAHETALLRDLQDSIPNLAGRGRLALWGAGAKGVTVANLVDPQQRWIDCLVDVNPKKQNRFIPGSGHPVVAYTELPQRQVRTALLMNPNYRKEIEDLLAREAIAVELR